VSVFSYSTSTTSLLMPSWGRLEMKPHEPKNRDKTRSKRRGKSRVIKTKKRKLKKGEKAIKRQVKKVKRGGKNLIKR
jgi:hypothetical protein